VKRNLEQSLDYERARAADALTMSTEEFLALFIAAILLLAIVGGGSQPVSQLFDRRLTGGNFRAARSR
jgi:hypothetical protein